MNMKILLRKKPVAITLLVIMLVILSMAGQLTYAVSADPPELRWFSVTQLGVTHVVEPIQNVPSAVDFYNYRSASGHTPHMEDSVSKIYLYSDGSELNQIMHHNMDNSLIYYMRVDFNLEGVPAGAYMALSDDPNYTWNPDRPNGQEFALLFITCSAFSYVQAGIIKDWSASVGSIERGKETPSDLSISFRNSGTNYVENVNILVVDPGDLEITPPARQIGYMSAGESRSLNFSVTAPEHLTPTDYVVTFQISYYDSNGMFSKEAKTASVTVVEGTADFPVAYALIATLAIVTIIVTASYLRVKREKHSEDE